MAEPEIAPEPAALADLALRVARQAGHVLLDGLARSRRITSTKSSATDVVTEIDERSEQLIVAAILAERPHDAILAEEDGERPGTSDVRWLVDPIDGTVNYLYGHPGFAVSIAAQLGGRTVAGVVLDPWRDESFVAVAGAGAMLNGSPLQANVAVADLAAALVATGFGYQASRRSRQAELLTRVLPNIRDIRRVGSAALDLCAVAVGRVDAYYEWGLQAWDLAAGALIAAEAGALVTDLAGRGPASVTGGALVAGPLLHPQLVSLLGDPLGDEYRAHGEH